MTLGTLLCNAIAARVSTDAERDEIVKFAGVWNNLMHTDLEDLQLTEAPRENEWF